MRDTLTCFDDILAEPCAGERQLAVPARLYVPFLVWLRVYVCCVRAYVLVGVGSAFSSTASPHLRCDA